MRATIKLKRGDDELRQITLTYPSGKVLDLSTLQRADLHAVTACRKGERVLELSTENQLIEVLNATEGKLLLHFPHHLTENENWTTADYDLQLTFVDGRIKTVLSGAIALSHDITKLGA